MPPQAALEVSVHGQHEEEASEGAPVLSHSCLGVKPLGTPHPEPWLICGQKPLHALYAGLVQRLLLTLPLPRSSQHCTGAVDYSCMALVQCELQLSLVGMASARAGHLNTSRTV